MKRRLIHRNLSTSYVDLPSLVGLLRRQKFNGVVHLETKDYEADVVLNGEDKPLARERDLTAGRVSVGDEVLERLLVRSREPGGTINVYEGVAVEKTGSVEPAIPKPIAAFPDKSNERVPEIRQPDNVVPEPRPKALPEITAESSPAMRQPDDIVAQLKPKTLPEITEDISLAIQRPDNIDHVPKPTTLPEETTDRPTMTVRPDNVVPVQETKTRFETTRDSPPAILQPDILVPEPKTLSEIAENSLPAILQPDDVDPVQEPKTLSEITENSPPAMLQPDDVDPVQEPKTHSEITKDSPPAMLQPDNVFPEPKPKTRFETTRESPPAILQPDNVPVEEPKTFSEITEITRESPPAILQPDNVVPVQEPKTLSEITKDSPPAMLKPDDVDPVQEPKTLSEISSADSPVPRPVNTPTPEHGEESSRKTGISLRSKPIKMGRSSAKPFEIAAVTPRTVEEPKTQSAFEYLKEKLGFRKLLFSSTNRVDKKAEQKAVSKGEDWEELLGLVGELLGTWEKCLSGSNLNFAWVFEKVRFDLSTDYPFLHPHSDFFVYTDGRIVIRDRIKPQLLVAGIMESLRKVTEKLEAYPKFDNVRELTLDSVRELMRQRRTEYDKFSLTIPLKRVIGI